MCSNMIRCDVLQSNQIFFIHTAKNHKHTASILIHMHKQEDNVVILYFTLLVHSGSLCCTPVWK